MWSPLEHWTPTAPSSDCSKPLSYTNILEFYLYFIERGEKKTNQSVTEIPANLTML